MSTQARGVFWVAFVVVFAALFPVTSAAETVECDSDLADIIRVHDFGLAYYCSELHLNDNPDDVEALLVAARAAQELGQADLALELATRARQLQLNDSQQFAALLISGMAAAGNDDALMAKIFLRRSANLAQNEIELRVVGAALAQVRAQSPWSYSLGFNLRPSNNINSGSIFDSDGIFEFDEASIPQLGIGYSLNTSVAHRTRISAHTLWENAVTATATIYSGWQRNNYNVSYRSALRYQPAGNTPTLWIGSISFAGRGLGNALGGPVFDDYSHDYSQTNIKLERYIAPRNGYSLMLYGDYTFREYETRGDADITQFGFSYGFPLTSNISASISGYWEEADSWHPLVAKESANVAIGLTMELEQFPIGLSGRLSYTNVNYKLPAPIYGYRFDEVIGLDIGVTPKKLQWYGFRPTFGLNVTRNISDSRRHNTFEANAYTRISSVF